MLEVTGEVLKQTEGLTDFDSHAKEVSGYKGNTQGQEQKRRDSFFHSSKSIKEYLKGGGGVGIKAANP